MHVFLRKSPLHKKHSFEWLKTAISSNACGTSTLKSLLPQGAYAPHVHSRLRKRLARCTLDCGSKTSESPALRGFVGERCPITGTSLYLVLKSNGYNHQENLLKKFNFLLKNTSANIVKKVIRTLTPQILFSTLSTSLTNASRSLSHLKSSTYSALREKSHTGTHTPKHGALRMGVVSLPSDRSARSQTSPGRVSERHTLPLWGLGRGCSQRTQGASGQRCAYARRCSEASRPRWAA